MKELIQSLEHTKMSSSRNMLLLDTCFIVNTLENPSHIKRLLSLKNLAMLSFNAEEFLHIEHSLSHDVRKNARKFFSDKNLSIIDVDVHPGDWKREKKFVSDIEPILLRDIADTSDAVLIAAAISTRSNVLTKDRHHIYTAVLKNLADKYNIRVCKELKDFI